MKKNRLSGEWLALALAAAPLAGPAVLARESESVELARKLNEAFIEVADKVSPAVVVIDVARKENGMAAAMEGGHPWINPDMLDQLPEQFRKFFEGLRDSQPKEEKEKEKEKEKKSRRPQAPQYVGQGSGCVIREDGYIVTNHHVVDGAERLRVRFKDGKEFEAEIRGTDAKSDLAVIKLKGEVKGLKAVQWADSEKVRVGEFAIAIGAPFDLEYSVTFGHVSAKGRGDVLPFWERQRRPGVDQDFIQTDASINPGNSGGPLVNIDGQVIGINSMIRGLNSGIGFAIPASLARQVTDAIIADGRFTRSWLGIGINSLREDRTYRSMVKGIEEGVVVNSFVENGPAAKSDLKHGDIITAVDGRSVATPEQLKSQIRNKPVGAVVNLDVHRRGKNLVVKVKTEAWPDEEGTIPTSHRRPLPAGESENKDLGVTVKAITRDTAAEYGLKEGVKGVVVSAVDADSLAGREGLRAGDVITEVNSEVVTSPKEFSDALQGVNIKEGVMLTIISSRDGVARFRPLKERSE